MSTHDQFGRAWLKLSEAKAGQHVELDDGFTCRASGVAKLEAEGEALYFKCADSKHFISGQADDGEHCVGIYPLESR